LAVRLFYSRRNLGFGVGLVMYGKRHEVDRCLTMGRKSKYGSEPAVQMNWNKADRRNSWLVFVAVIIESQFSVHYDAVERVEVIIALMLITSCGLYLHYCVSVIPYVKSCP
jgi:hypothetical protein